MKKYGWISLMLCVLLLLGGCAKEQEAAVQPPEFPLDEQTVFDAFEDAGFSVILSEEDTEAQPDRVRVTLRDPERTYAEGRSDCQYGAGTGDDALLLGRRGNSAGCKSGRLEKAAWLS